MIHTALYSLPSTLGTLPYGNNQGERETEIDVVLLPKRNFFFYSEDTPSVLVKAFETFHLKNAAPKVGLQYWSLPSVEAL